MAIRKKKGTEIYAPEVALPEFEGAVFDVGMEFDTLGTVDSQQDNDYIPEEEDVSLELPEAPEEKKKKGHRRTTELVKVKETLYWRKAYGVTNLLKVMGLERPEQGAAYHIISGGNVDLLCHLQWLMLHFPRLDRVFISAWAVSGADILLLEDMQQKGNIRTLDVLVGDIYPNQYKFEWRKLTEMRDTGIIRALYSSNIHSKFIMATDGKDMWAVCESSANCNMNPRIEQTVMTFDRRLYEFYDKYYHNLFVQEDIIATAQEFRQLTTEPSV